MNAVAAQRISEETNFSVCTVQTLHSAYVRHLRGDIDPTEVADLVERIDLEASELFYDNHNAVQVRNWERSMRAQVWAAAKEIARHEAVDYYGRKR